MTKPQLKDILLKIGIISLIIGQGLFWSIRFGSTGIHNWVGLYITILSFPCFIIVGIINIRSRGLKID